MKLDLMLSKLYLFCALSLLTAANWCNRKAAAANQRVRESL
jgi:hypothetical protein